MNWLYLISTKKFVKSCNSIESADSDKQKAFSLLEILVAMTLVALFTAVFLSDSINIFRESLESYTRKCVNIFRDSRDQAILNGTVVRIRFDIDNQSYWVEEAPPDFLLPKSNPDAERVPVEDTDDDSIKKPSSPFKLIDRITKKAQKIPEGIRLVSAVSARVQGTIQDGLVEIYFFPHGAGETAVLHLQDEEGNKRSLVIQPITGKTKIEAGFYYPNEEKR